jgi:hypothetical protein
VTWLKTEAHTNAVPASSLIGQKWQKTATPSASYAGVVFGPHLLDHVFRGEINAGIATGYHSRTLTTRTGNAPYAIQGTTHRLAAIQVISRPDEFGVYYVGYRLSYTAQGQTQTTAWKISTMFPDRLGQAAIVKMIKVAFVNQRTDTSASVDWAGLHDNGMRIGGRTTGVGAIKSAFPAYKGSFEIPDYVSARFADL